MAVLVMLSTFSATEKSSKQTTLKYPGNMTSCISLSYCANNVFIIDLIAELRYRIHQLRIHNHGYNE